jgi:hypothetical protein
MPQQGDLLLTLEKCASCMSKAEQVQPRFRANKALTRQSQLNKTVTAP